MTPRWKLVRRIGVAVVLAGSFLVMASVFSPQRSKAGDVGTAATDRSSMAAPFSDSTDPHEGLRSLGTLEGRTCVVKMFATPDGARYSLYEKSTGRELGVLMTPQRVHEWFPELQLPNTDFSAPAERQSPLMMAEPEAFQQ